MSQLPLHVCHFVSSALVLDACRCSNSMARASASYLQQPFGEPVDMLVANLVLDVDDARHLLSTYMRATSEVASPWPVLAPCRATATEPAAVLGLRRETRGVVSYRLPLMSDAPTSKSAAPPLAQLLQRYRAAAPPAPTENKPVQRATAVYDIVGSSEDPSISSVAVLFEWIDPPAVFAPPPYSATSLMRARVLPGDPKSPASWLFADIHLLNTMSVHTTADAAVDGAAWATEGPGIRDAVSDFLKGLNTDADRPTASSAPPAGDHSHVNTIIGKLSRRSDLDFTERLWELCKGAISFDDLRGSLAQVFRALQMGQVQPMVHKSNTTAIGTVARQCLLRTSDPTAASQLSENLQRLSDPAALVTAVVEIGLAKLRRDYVAYFVSEELSTGQQLEHFVSDRVALNERVARLHRLHDVLELVLTIKTYCDIPHTSLRQLFMNGLQYYKAKSSKDGGVDDGPASTEIPTFELRFPSFSESASKVKRLCAQMDPSRWTVGLSNETWQHDCTTTIFSTTLDLFGVAVTESDDTLGYAPLEDDNETCFYYTTTTETRHTAF